MWRNNRPNFWGMVKKVIDKCDIIIEVVDARFPFDSRNEGLEKLVLEKRKKLVIVINKADLVPKHFVHTAMEKINKEFPCIYLSSRERHGTRNLMNVLNSVRKGKYVKMGVVGYPNTGKSTVINILRGRHSAPTSSNPGFTRSIQWIRVSPDILMMDTPGVLSFRAKNELFSVGAMNVQRSKNAPDIVTEFIGDLKAKRSEKGLIEKYGLEIDPLETYLERFAEKYKLTAKGGIPDVERAAKRIFNDWLKGKLKAYWK